MGKGRGRDGMEWDNEGNENRDLIQNPNPNT